MRLGYQIDTSERPDLVNPNAVQPEKLQPMPENGSPGARQSERQSQAMVGMGDAITRAFVTAQDDANQVRVNDAVNQVMRAKLDLAYNPDSGYLQKTGIDAQPGQDGTTLAQNYGDQLQSRIADISSNLGNDRQRELFGMAANNQYTDFIGGVEKHSLDQFKKYSLDVQDGAIKLGMNDAETNWSDPDKIQASLRSVSAAVVRAGALIGQPANLTASQLQVATSQVHTKVIQAALENHNPDYAQQYMQTFKDGMTADDILKVTGALTRDVDVRASNNAVQQARVESAPQFQPSDQTRLTGIILGLESGKQGDLDKNGNPLTSSAGAKYAMQVMPETAKNPGFGIMPARDDSPAEYNRVGQQYIAAMVQKYASVPQAMAAYNAGPGNVDDAIHEATKDGQPQKWLSYLPQETQTYVQNGMAKFNAGGGQPPKPTLQEFEDSAVAKLGPNPTPAQLELTKAAAQRQFAVTTASQKQTEDSAKIAVYQELAQNGGDYQALSSTNRDNLLRVAPEALPQVIGFAKAVSKGENQQSDQDVIAKLNMHPQDMTKMSDADWMGLRSSLSQRDFNTYTIERTNLQNGRASDDPRSIDSGAVWSSLSNKMKEYGINVHPMSTDTAANAAIGARVQFVRDQIGAYQQQIGHKLKGDEVDQFVDGLFQKNVETPQGGIGGWFARLAGGAGVEQRNMLTMSAGDIPGTQRDQITTYLQSKGITKPTDAQILNQYWSIESKR